MKVAVVGHIEWGTFAHVDHVPAAGEIEHVAESWHEAAGGGAVAAMQLAMLNGSCLFFTAVGDDEEGQKSLAQLRARGVEVYAATRQEARTNTVFVDIDKNGERTITVAGNVKPNAQSDDLPWDKLAEMDAVFFVSGDKAALQFARRAKTLISTARILPVLKDSGVGLDALVSSQQDGHEQYRAGDLNPAPRVVITTNGVHGGQVNDGATYQAEVVSKDDMVDMYGCGDSFAAGLTFGLGSGQSLPDALKTAVHAGADAARRHGAFGN